MGGWIEHEGGGRPHEPGTYVEVEFRDGAIERGCSAFLCWPWADAEDDDPGPERDVLRWREIPKPPTKDDVIDDLIAALEKARDQFLFYELSHLAKYSERDLDLVRKGIVDVPLGRDAYDKALVNREMADMCAAALAKASSTTEGEGA